MAKLKVKQYSTLPKAALMDAQGHIIIILLETATGVSWPAPDNVWPYADVLKQRWKQHKDKDDLTPLTTDLPNASGTHVTLACVKPDISAFDLLTLARKLCSAHLGYNPSEIMLLLPGMDKVPEVATASRVTEAIVAALMAGVFAMPNFKSKPPKPKRLVALHVYGVAGVDLERTFAEAEGNNLARYLTSLPPNELTPALYRQRIAELAEQHGWNMHFFDSKALRRQKAGAFLAVAQGSADDDAGIVQLCYHPPKARDVHGRTSVAKGTTAWMQEVEQRREQLPRMQEATIKAVTKRRLSLVGKGICYDTGGNNLKPAKSMFGMHEDMEGSAVALGTLLALTRLKVDFSVHCWLALAQNHIGPKAYKQNDVVTASNGVSIEIVHTDAEGRMVLADTLVMASAEHPDLIVDYATLTGTCVYALGTRYSGAFTNRDALAFDIIEAGRNSGERVWPFPTDSDYDKELESDIADVKQCVLAGEADHILAARFLSRFVREDVPWLHIDLAAGNHKGGLAHIPTDVSGFGVRFTLNLVLDRNVLGIARQKN